MLCNTEPVVVNHGFLCWASGCESWFIMLSQWLWIMVSYAGPVVVNWWYAMMSQWLWIMDCYALPKVVNHGELGRASGCESWRAMLSRWLWIMVSYPEPVVVNHEDYFVFFTFNHNVLCIFNFGFSPKGICLNVASGCESWFIMLSQWLWIMVYHAEPVVVNHGLLCGTSGCESWFIIQRQWLWIMVYYSSQWLWIVLCYPESVVVNHGELFTEPVVVNHGVLC